MGKFRAVAPFDIRRRNGNEGFRCSEALLLIPVVAGRIALGLDGARLRIRFGWNMAGNGKLRRLVRPLND